MRFFRQVVRRKCRRLHTLDVPQVEILMAYEAEKAAVFIRYALISARRKVFASANIGGRPAVFKSAVSAARCVQQEQITVQVSGSAKQ